MESGEEKGMKEGVWFPLYKEKLQFKFLVAMCGCSLHLESWEKRKGKVDFIFVFLKHKKGE